MLRFSKFTVKMNEKRVTLTVISLCMALFAWIPQITFPSVSVYKTLFVVVIF